VGTKSQNNKTDDHGELVISNTFLSKVWDDFSPDQSREISPKLGKFEKTHVCKKSQDGEPKDLGNFQIHTVVLLDQNRDHVASVLANHEKLLPSPLKSCT
jgi:hypothetical protein